MRTNGSGTGRVGLVVSGGGARGAYEAGALSVLLAAMTADRNAPDVLVGTSAGALAVVTLGGAAERGWPAAAASLCRAWADVRFDQLADVAGSLAADGPAYLAFLARVGGRDVGPASLLDTRRLRATLARQLPFAQLHENVRSGRVGAVAVATTSLDTDATVIFVERHPSVPLPADNPHRNIRWVDTALDVDHVLASSAVPALFRAVELPDGHWYADGGIRLNTPLAPAVSLGCDRLGVVVTHPTSWRTAPRSMPRPDLFSGIAAVLRAVLVDRMVEDLARLSTINRLVTDHPTPDCPHVRFVVAGPPPSDGYAVGRLAAAVLAAHQGPLAELRRRDVRLLDRLVGGDPVAHAELLSLLYFDPGFTRPAIALGARHARETLPWARDGRLNWCADLDELDGGAQQDAPAPGGTNATGPAANRRARLESIVE